MASALEYLDDHYGDCETLLINSSGSLTGGDPLNKGNKVGIVKEDVSSSGVDVPIIIGTPHKGISVPKQSTSWSVGDAIYYDPGSNDFSSDSAVGNHVGHATASAAGGDSRGRVALTNEKAT